MRYLLLPTLCMTLCLFSFNDSNAQRRVTYQELVLRTEQPNIYVDYVSLPSIDGDYLFQVSFRMDYDLLPFIRTDVTENRDEGEFYSTARMNVEIFGGHSENRRQSFDPVSNMTWSDTAFAATYEQTRSRSDHLEGAVSFQLNPGDYHMLLNLNRGETSRETRSRERNFTIDEYGEGTTGEIVLVESDRENGAGQLKLLNYGEYVLYGQDHMLLVLLPPDAAERPYQLRVEQLASGSDTETVGEPLYSHTISSGDLTYTNGFQRLTDQKKPILTYATADEGYPLFLAEIPNSQYPNASFRLTLTPDDGGEPVVEKIVSSKWIDIPVSLLNLDVSINMLKFVADENTIRSLNSGSSAERERKFREFWSERDPTPESEFNELMAEYYRRIDDAYDQFTTYEQAGYDSDQGRAYITFGPPITKERRLPVDGPAREVWVYRNQTLVFEATSGFGDFKLIGRE